MLRQNFLVFLIELLQRGKKKLFSLNTISLRLPRIRNTKVNRQFNLIKYTFETNSKLLYSLDMRHISARFLPFRKTNYL